MFSNDDRALRTIARGAPEFTRVPNYYDWGWKQYKLVDAQLTARGREIDPKRSWLQIIRDMKKVHPFAEELVYNGIQIARKTREWTIKNDLVSKRGPRAFPQSSPIFLASLSGLFLATLAFKSF